MRYPATEKLEIIRLVEQSHLSVRRTLELEVPSGFLRQIREYPLACNELVFLRNIIPLEAFAFDDRDLRNEIAERLTM